jgi:acetyl esterase
LDERRGAAIRSRDVQRNAERLQIDRQPPLGHEYQFDLDSEAGQLFLERIRTFLRRRVAAPSRP